MKSLFIGGLLFVLTAASARAETVFEWCANFYEWGQVAYLADAEGLRPSEVISTFPEGWTQPRRDIFTSVVLQAYSKQKLPLGVADEWDRILILEAKKFGADQEAICLREN